MVADHLADSLMRAAQQLLRQQTELNRLKALLKPFREAVRGCLDESGGTDLVGAYGWLEAGSWEALRDDEAK